MPSTKLPARTALFALLGSGSSIAADLLGDEAAVVDIAVEVGSEILIPDEEDALGLGLGAECVPSAPTHMKRGDPKNTDVDVGVLSKRSACRANEECVVDAASSLGGRCVAAATGRRTQSTSGELLLAECLGKCPTSKLCGCFFGDAECAPDDIASACRNGEHKNCLNPTNATTGEVFYCPVVECMADLGGVANASNWTALEESNWEMCYVCVGYKRACAFCGAGGTNPFCNDYFTDENCDGFRANQTYMYRSNCTGFHSSAGRAAVGSAAALTLLSMAVMSRD